MPIINSGSDFGRTYRETFTLRAETADEFIANITEALGKKYECVSVSPSMPILISESLSYTVTITASDLI